MRGFAMESVSDALERAIRNASHLRARDAAAVAAARKLARKIDAWDTIVDWAIEDASDSGRPLVPANDNVSLPTFLKYLDSLGLVPPQVAAAPRARGSQPKDELTAFRQKHRIS